MQKKMMDKKETAAFFGVSERTLERWVLSGLLPQGVRSGRKVYWTIEALAFAKANLKDGFERRLDTEFKRYRAAVLNG